jgi:hypothetical protein
MTLYKGENVEEVIAELEDDRYIWTRRRMQMSDNGQVIRPLFSVLDDDGESCVNDDLCYCYWYPQMPLASTTWTADDEKAWLEEEVLPELPHETFNHYFRENQLRRDKWLEYHDRMRRRELAEGLSSGH